MSNNKSSSLSDINVNPLSPTLDPFTILSIALYIRKLLV